MTLRSIRSVQRGSMVVLAVVVVAGLVALGRFAPSLGEPSAQGPTGRAAVLSAFPPGAHVLAAGSSLMCVPTSAHSSGANGANWRTDVEVQNPGTTQANFTIALLVRNADNSNPTKVNLSLAPGLAQRYTDIVASVFQFSGAAALQITVTSGSLVIASDTYNQLAAGNPWGFPGGSTYGQYGPAMTSDQAITSSDQGRLIQLSHDPSLSNNFRTNLGVINATTLPIGVTIDLYSASGVELGSTIGVTLRGLEYQQLDKVFENVTKQVVSDGYAIVRTTTAGGSFFAYASVIDNRTGDPFLIPAAKLPAGSNPPTPTPTVPGPTSTPTRTPVGPTPTPTQAAGVSADLRLYTPSDWPACVVCDYQNNWTSSVTPALYTYDDTYVYANVANFGASTFSSPLDLALYIDGVYKGTWNWANTSGLATDYYVTLPLDYSAHDISAGQHSVRVTIDPSSKLNLANRAAGSCSANWTWSSIIFAPPSAGMERGDAIGGGHTVEAGRGPVGNAWSGAELTAAAGNDVRDPHFSAFEWGERGELADGRGGAEPGDDAGELHDCVVGEERGQLEPDEGEPEPCAGVGAAVHGHRGVCVSVFRGCGAADHGDVGFAGDRERYVQPVGGGEPVGFSGRIDVRAVRAGDDVGPGDHVDDQGRLIQLSHDPSLSNNFRTNLGVINATTLPIGVTIDLYSASGVELGSTIGVTLRGLEYQQLDKVFEERDEAVVSDGYAIVRTTTAGGSFFAYASVIDNRTGTVPDPGGEAPGRVQPADADAARPDLHADPDARRPDPDPDGARPTPTATPTGQVPTPPPVVAPSSGIRGILATMGLIGTKSPSIDSLVSTALTTGVPALVNMAVNYSPSTRTSLRERVRWNFGNGTTNAHGTYTGTIDLTYSNLLINGNSGSAQYNVQTTNFTKNGAVRPFDHVSGTVSVQQGSSGKTTGTVTLNGGGTVTYTNGSKVTSAAISATGSVQFDTSGVRSIRLAARSPPTTRHSSSSPRTR